LRWIKKGNLVPAEAVAGWAASHAALPFAAPSGSGYRVYFSPRDAHGRAQIGRFELEWGDPPRVGAAAAGPLLPLGELGAFDDAGVTMSCLVDHQGRQYLYYSGWSRGVSVPFYFYVGLAVSDDGGRSFERWSRGPILERDAVDPYLTASPWILVENGTWRMWYVSGTGWERVEGAPRHRYHVKYAESKDGLRWRRQGVVCIDFAGPGEYAIARPCVLKDGSRYRMWFCHRGDRYRIGYAESKDGIRWERDDPRGGMDASESGWDSEMVAYPFVFRRDRLYMLYNGNGYGRTGIGLACAEE
jgi:hypothetical protein